MWKLLRVDRLSRYERTTVMTDFFVLQSAYRKRDLDIDAARNSGFVGPQDEVILVNPDGDVRDSWIGRC